MSPELRIRHPEIPWQLIISTRNRLIHAYFDINLEIVWATASQALPTLIPLLENLLDEDTSS